MMCFLYVLLWFNLLFLLLLTYRQWKPIISNPGLILTFKSLSSPILLLLCGDENADVTETSEAEHPPAAFTDPRREHTHTSHTFTFTDQYLAYTWITWTPLPPQVSATAEWFIRFPFLCHSDLVMQQIRQGAESFSPLVSLFHFVTCFVKYQCNTATQNRLPPHIALASSSSEGKIIRKEPTLIESSERVISCRSEFYLEAHHRFWYPDAVTWAVTQTRITFMSQSSLCEWRRSEGCMCRAGNRSRCRLWFRFLHQL